MKARIPSAGFTLLELVITVALLALIFGTSFALSAGTSGAYAGATDEVELTERASLGTTAIVDALRGGSGTTLSSPTGPGAPGEVTQAIWFQRAKGFDPLLGELELDPLETIAFEPDAGDPEDGADNDGDGLVDEGRVVWTTGVGEVDEHRVVLCRDVLRTGAGELAGNGLDDDGDGVIDEPGFAVVWDIESVQIQLAVGFRSRSGDVLVRSATRAVAFRN